MAICVTFLMVFATISAISLLKAPAAHADACTISTSASAVDATTVSCPAGWNAGINLGSGDDDTNPDPCTGLGCTTTPITNTNITITYGTLSCLYSGVSQADSYKYPVNNPRSNCIPQSPYSVCTGGNGDGNSCSVPLTCPPQAGKPALKLITSTVVQRVYKNGRLTRTVTTIRGYCVYPGDKASTTETYTNASTTGYCAVNGKETLWRSDSASTIRTGANGSVSPAGVSSVGSEGSGTAGISQNFTVGLDKSSAAKLAATCKQGVYEWKAPLPKDTVNGGSILSYYRLTAKTNYKRCYIKSYAPIFNIEPVATCESGTTPVYEHNRFTNTCRYGVVEGVHTEYEKYFDPSTCDSSWECHPTKTKIANSSTNVNLTRNGNNVKVDYGTFSVTGNNVTPDKTSYKRKSSVVDGSTPYYGSDPNSDKQFFKMYTDGTGTYTSGNRINFDTYYLLSKLGQTTNIQFYWASDAGSPWHIETTYKFHGTFQVRESSKLDGGVNLVNVEDDATCPDPAQSANANVLRSVNVN